MRGKITTEVMKKLLERANFSREEILKAAEEAASKVDPFEYDSTGRITDLKFDQITFAFNEGSTEIILLFKGMRVYTFSELFTIGAGSTYTLNGVNAKMGVDVTP